MWERHDMIIFGPLWYTACFWAIDIPQITNCSPLNAVQEMKEIPSIAFYESLWTREAKMENEISL